MKANRPPLKRDGDSQNRRRTLARARFFCILAGVWAGLGPMPPSSQAASPPYGAGAYRQPGISWLDIPPNAGDWHLATMDGETDAEFANRNEAPIARWRCHAALHRITFEWLWLNPGISTAGISTGGTAVVTTTSIVRSHDLLANGPYAQMVFYASDPLLDAIAFSRGRFMVDAAQSRLILPVRPEIARIIEDCRQP